MEIGEGEIAYRYEEGCFHTARGHSVEQLARTCSGGRIIDFKTRLNTVRDAF